MNLKSVTNIITKPRYLGPAVFIGMGAYKTCSDYKKAKPERKKRVLAKDISIILGSAVAFGAVSPLTKRFCHLQFMELTAKGIEKMRKRLNSKPFFQKSFFKKLGNIRNSFKQTQKITYESLKNTEHVLKETIAGTINTFAGILGAVYTNEVMQKYVLNKPPFAVSPSTTSTGEPQKAHVNKVQSLMHHPMLMKHPTAAAATETASVTASRIFETIADLPAMRAFEKPMVALTGFSVADTKGYHNKFKKASYELLANALIPTIFVSITSLLTAKTKWFVKYPAMVASLGVGATIGTKIADKYKDAIDERIDDIDMKHIVIR